MSSLGCYKCRFNHKCDIHRKTLCTKLNSERIRSNKLTDENLQLKEYIKNISGVLFG